MLFFVVTSLVLLFIFFLMNFNFIGVLMLLENLNILLLVTMFMYGLNTGYYLFIIYIVVATMEVTFGLVVLTRVWDFDSLIY